MTLRLYNTLTRKKENFKPINPKLVTFYSCGPTVYNFAHIGNFRAYMSSDLLKRYLKYKGFTVKHVMNITDVDDKTIRDSRKERITLTKFTEKYTKAFFEDIKTLAIEPADIFPKATENIPGMVQLIKKLLSKGYAYKADDGIYFKISKFKDYGKLSKIDLSQRRSGARICSDEYDKESAHDFSLWKFWTLEDGDVFWETEIGKGRPGWHIECSVMSGTNLSLPFDIHSGGVDLIFPHHENEIAQSEAATGKQFVKYWFHNEYILVDGHKMSKSLGNFFTLRDILEKGYKPKAIRYLLLATHYKQPLNFTFDGLKAAQAAVERLMEFMDRLKHAKGKDNRQIDELVADMKQGFQKSMDDDLNISAALGEIFEFVKHVNKLNAENAISQKDSNKIISAMNEIDTVLGLLKEEKTEIPKDILELVQEREKAREAKDFKRADSIRDKLKEKGFTVDDTPQGPRIKPL